MNLLMKKIHVFMYVCISPSRKMFKIQIRRMATLKTTKSQRKEQ